MSKYNYYYLIEEGKEFNVWKKNKRFVLNRILLLAEVIKNYNTNLKVIVL